MFRQTSDSFLLQMLETIHYWLFGIPRPNPRKSFRSKWSLMPITTVESLRLSFPQVESIFSLLETVGTWVEEILIRRFASNGLYVELDGWRDGPCPPFHVEQHGETGYYPMNMNAILTDRLESNCVPKSIRNSWPWVQIRRSFIPGVRMKESKFILRSTMKSAHLFIQRLADL